MRLHDLGHTSATIALDAGHDVREVSEWLGHADYTTTLWMHAHWIPAEAHNSMALAVAPAAAGAPTNVTSLVPRRRSAG